MKSYRCGCCGEIGSKLSMHTHHKKPQALGGTDHPSNLVDLCPNCHDALHNAAYKLANPKFSDSKVKDQIAIIYKDNLRAAQTCWNLALLVRDAMLSSVDEGVDTNALINVSTVLRMEHKMDIARIAKEHGISQEAFVRTVLLREIARITNKKVDVSLEHKIIRTIKRKKKRH